MDFWTALGLILSILLGAWNAAQHYRLEHTLPVETRPPSPYVGSEEPGENLGATAENAHEPWAESLLLPQGAGGSGGAGGTLDPQPPH